jgi:hypothetical protein
MKIFLSSKLSTRGKINYYPEMYVNAEVKERVSYFIFATGSGIHE